MCTLLAALERGFLRAAIVWHASKFDKDPADVDGRGAIGQLWLWHDEKKSKMNRSR